MFFQTLDDKAECVGVYTAGKLYFDEIPTDLSKTWKYTGSVVNPGVEYAWLYALGKSLQDVCPDTHKEILAKAQQKFRAYLKAFKIGKISLKEHCFFDLVPESFLMEFCEIKNKITEHVFETYQRPENYDHLVDVHRLLQKIKYQKLNLTKDDCRDLYHTSLGRKKANELLKNFTYIDYNLFGTVTGRLTTLPGSFPILTLKKEFRRLLKPHNDWFISLDYNAAEARTMLQLNEQEQPPGDVHRWNIEQLFDEETERETAKTIFFAWLYNPDSEVFESVYYDRKKVLDKWYREGYIYTPYGRKILVDDRRALNYLIQSATADRVLQRAVDIDKFLEGKRSFISHIVHDEIVIDLNDDERSDLAEIKKIFEQDNFKANIQAAKNYFDFKELKI